jgi:HK97 gp10 family phage protein
MKMTITVEDHSDEVLAALKNAIERGDEAIGETAEAHAKDNVTKQIKDKSQTTGRLRNSITNQTKQTDTGYEVTIGTDVEYATYFEFGTGKYSSIGGGTTKESWVYQDDYGDWHRAYPQRPRPFLEPAVSEHVSEYVEILKDSLENA